MKEALKRKDKKESFHPFKYYEIVGEISDKNTAQIIEKQIYFLHEILLLQKMFMINFPKATIEVIYEAIQRLGNSTTINFEWLFF